MKVVVTIIEGDSEHDIELQVGDEYSDYSDSWFGFRIKEVSE